MNAVNGTSNAVALSAKTEFAYRSENSRAEKGDSAHHEHRHDHVKLGHGSKRANHVFRQEMIQALEVKFRSTFRLSVSSSGPYQYDPSSEALATDVVGTAKDLVERSTDTPSKTLNGVRETVEQAVTASRQYMGTDDGADALEETRGLIKDGLGALENDPTLTAASSFSVESSSKQRSSIRIRTQEGDVVKFDLRRKDKMTASDVAVTNESGTSSVTEVSVSSRSRLILKVDGDLNDAELEAIRNVFAQAEQLAEEFFAGDMNAALQVATGLEYDSDQLARVSMKFRSSQQISAEQTVFQRTPVVEQEAPAATPVVTEPVAASRIEASVADPVDARNVAAPEDTSVGDRENTDATSGVGSLVNFLGMIADYLQQSFGQLDLAPDQDPTGLRMHLDISQSFRLKILQSVFTELTPDSTESETGNDNTAIDQLDADLDSSS